MSFQTSLNRDCQRRVIRQFRPSALLHSMQTLAGASAIDHQGESIYHELAKILVFYLHHNGFVIAVGQGRPACLYQKK